MFFNTTEIANGKAVQRFRFQPVLNGQRLADEPDATLTVKSPDGVTTLVDGVTMLWNSTDFYLYYDFDTSDTATWLPSEYLYWPLDFWYKATIEWSEAVEEGDPAGETYVDERLFAVVLNVWRCGVAAQDILAIDDSAAMFVDDPDDWVGKIQESIAMVYTGLAAQRPALSPGMIINRQMIDQFVAYKTLALFWGRRAVEKDQYAENNLHVHYNGLADGAWSEALQTAHVDIDNSGVIDEEPSQPNTVNLRP